MSCQELIELQELPQEDRIELTLHTRSTRLERTNALRVSPGKVPELLSRVRIIRLLRESVDPRLTIEEGEGHDFQPCTHAQPTWCDLCGDFIWGLYRQSLRCTYCKFTCHYRCRALIQLDCSAQRSRLVDQPDPTEHAIETDTNIISSLVHWVVGAAQLYPAAGRRFSLPCPRLPCLRTPCPQHSRGRPSLRLAAGPFLVQQ